MRKFLLVLHLCVNCLILFSTAAHADMQFEYKMHDTGVVITKFSFDGDTEIAELPNYIDGLPVTAIGKYAFSSLNTPFCVVNKLVLPNTLIELQEGALHQMSAKVMEVQIPASLLNIDDYAFSGTMTTIILPDDHSAFYKKDGFLIEKKSQKAICCDADKQNEASIVIPEGIKVLGASLFYSWMRVEKIVLPKSLLDIQEYAFAGCISLSQIVFHEEVRSIGNGAFRECSELSELYLPLELIYIGDECFMGCSKLTTLRCPNKLKVIGSSAFEQIDLVSDEGLHELEFNEGLLYIGERAFYKNQLTRLDLPYSVSYIGEDAFAENPLK